MTILSIQLNSRLVRARPAAGFDAPMPSNCSVSFGSDSGNSVTEIVAFGLHFRKEGAMNGARWTANRGLLEDFEFEFYQNPNSKKVKFSGGWGLSANGSWRSN